MTFTFRVAGDPIPQGSLRFLGRGRVIPDNPGLKSWRGEITAEALTAAEEHDFDTPYDGPVEVEALFFLPRPKTVRRRHPDRAADLDKLQRALGDALCPRDPAIRTLTNDSRIIRWVTAKEYADGGIRPGVIVTIREVPT